MNNKVKDLLIMNLVCIILFIVLSIITSNVLGNKFKEQQLISNSYIIGGLVEKYPDLEGEIVSTILNNGNYELGNEIIEKYGITDDNFNYSMNINSSIIKNNLTITIISLLSLLAINILYVKKYFDRAEKLDNYINKVISDDYSIDVNKYIEGDIFNLKKDVSKLVKKLESANLLLENERHDLEKILEDIYRQMRLDNTNIKVNSKNVALRNQKQVERIELLLSGLIKLAKLDSGTTKLSFDKIKLSSLITKSIEPLKGVISSKNIEIKLNIRNTDVYVDVAWMSEAIFNILKNACQYTRDEIVIESNTNQDYTEIRISNNGRPINPNDLPTLFDKFNNSTAETIGIGLNFTKEVIERQNGTIEVINDEKPTFVIRLYKNEKK